MANVDDFGRYTDVALLILLSIANGEKHGYAIMQDIAAFSGAKLEPGTLYGALLRLERRGLIVPLPAADRRHPYQLTQAGSTALRQQLNTLQRIVATGIRRQVVAAS